MSLEQWTLPNGQVVKLGLRPRPAAFSFSTSIKWAEIPELPEKEWREFDYRKTAGYPLRVRDQDGVGACTHFAWTGALMFARWLAGYDHVELSPFFGYANAVDGNDVGSSISEAANFAANVGYCRDDLVKYGTLRKRDISAAAYENAKRYKVEITLGKHPAKDGDNGFRAMCLSAQYGYPVILSLSANTMFNELDDDLVPLNMAGPHNHSEWAGFAMTRSHRTGEWLLGVENSWTEGWGDRGYHNAAKRTLAGTYRDSASIVAVRVLSDENPPVAVF